MGRRGGFSLVVTVTILALLAMVAVGVLSLSTITVRSSNRSSAQLEARANARLALMLALGELQKAAGPDQRVTAPAGILSGTGPAAGESRTHWTGVWDTADYNPENPDDRTFVRWLVSSNKPTAPATPADAAVPAGSDDVLIFDGGDAAASVRVPKVRLNDGAMTRRYLAYWVEDEGLKADLGWNEGGFTSEEQKQAARLSATPGVDHEVFEGPFSGKVNHPIRIDTNREWISNLDKALSVAEMPLVTNAPGAHESWRREHRHDMTLGSRGVLADVKRGGLRRDLSLAFEMDGVADVSATSRPDKFNEQVGEFVGGDDQLSAPKAAMGMGGVKERFVYRVTRNDGTPFSGELTRPDSVVRGPNWWALRDYANLYKRLKGSGDDYALQARSYYPNVSAAKDVNYDLPSMAGVNSRASLWDHEFNNGNSVRVADDYIYRPARANYAPVLLGSVTLYSALVTNVQQGRGNLALGIDPFFYLWNPYNRTLEVPRYAIRLIRGYGGHITFRVGGATYGPAKIQDYVREHVRGSGGGSTAGFLSYLVSDLTMAPGEVVVVSPGSDRSGGANEYHDNAFPGTNADNASGTILRKIQDARGRWRIVPVNLTDTVECIYSNYYDRNAAPGTATRSFEHFWMDAYLPDAGVAAGDLTSDLALGEHVQQIGGNLAGTLAIPENFDPPRGRSMPTSRGWPSFAAGNRVNRKFFFGINSHLAKPADFAADYSMPNRNPVEVFSQYNPFRMVTTTEYWRPCMLNEVYNAVSRNGEVNTLLQDVAVNFSATYPERGYWGTSYSSGSGSTAVPLVHIPSGPVISLADFSNANLATRASEPFKSVGNSRASIFVPSRTIYAQSGGNTLNATASDVSWLINDALFDGYYLSGMAPGFRITPGGYNATGSIEETLEDFFGEDHRGAKANPVLKPYLPEGATAELAVADLSADDGYRKTGAYSLIDGAFNVNSTSVAAWRALLRGNRDLDVAYGQSGGSERTSGTPFPLGASPPAPGNGAKTHWSGFSRLSDSQIDALAEKIVDEVKERGPFMSLSDFVNRRVGTTDAGVNSAGALQDALDAVGAMTGVKTYAGGVDPVYPMTAAVNQQPYFAGDSPIGSPANRKTTEGIAGDITQADLLRPLAPRLSARSDTFRIRGYGEVRSQDGGRVIARATCEAVVQRVPDYLDHGGNDPWDEDANSSGPGASVLTGLNQRFGRRFRIVRFRWLAPEETRPSGDSAGV